MNLDEDDLALLATKHGRAIAYVALRLGKFNHVEACEIIRSMLARESPEVARESLARVSPRYDKVQKRRRGI